MIVILVQAKRYVSALFAGRGEILALAFGSLGLRALQVISAFGFSILATRMFGVASFGLMAMSLATASMISIFLNGGLNEVIVRDGVRLRHDRVTFFRLLRSADTYTICAGLVIAIIGLVIAVIGFVASSVAFDGDAVAIISASVILALVIALSTTRTAALRADDRALLGQGFHFVSPSIFGIVGLLVLNHDEFPIDVRFAPLAAIMFGWLATLGCLALLRGRPIEIGDSIHGGFKTSMRSDAAWFALAALAGVALMQGGLVVVGIVAGEAEAGVYRLAVQVAMLVSIGAQALGGGLAHRIAMHVAVGRQVSAMRLALGGAALGGAIAIVVFGGLQLFGRDVIALAFGAIPERAFHLAIALSMGQVASSFLYMASPYLAMSGGGRVVALVSLAAATVQGVATAPAVAFYGTMGAAAVFSATQVGAFACMALFAVVAAYRNNGTAASRGAVSGS